MTSVKLGTFTYLDFKTLGKISTVDTGYVSPKNSVVMEYVVEVTEAFSLSGTYAFLGGGSDINLFEYNYGADVFNIGLYGQSTGVIDSFTADTPITATIITDGELNTLTSGSATIYAIIVSLDQFTKEVTSGNTTFVITKDCWLNASAILGTTGNEFAMGTIVSGTDLGIGTIDSTGVLSFSNSRYFSETVDTTIYVTQTSGTDPYKLKLSVK